jgi:hypothetical protein
MFGQSSRLWKTKVGRDSNSLGADVLHAGSRALLKKTDEVVVRDIPMLYPTELRRLATLAGIEPATVGSMYSKPAVGLKDGQRNSGSDSTFSRCSPNRQLAVRDAGGNRTHFDRVAAGCLAVQLQRQASSSGVEPDPRPSQGRMRSATLRGQTEPTAGFAPA